MVAWVITDFDIILAETKEKPTQSKQTKPSIYAESYEVEVETNMCTHFIDKKPEILHFA